VGRAPRQKGRTVFYAVLAVIAVILLLALFFVRGRGRSSV
jgi:hypothetical protein